MTRWMFPPFSIGQNQLNLACRCQIYVVCHSSGVETEKSWRRLMTSLISRIVKTTSGELNLARKAPSLTAQEWRDPPCGHEPSLPAHQHPATPTFRELEGRSSEEVPPGRMRGCYNPGDGRASASPPLGSEPALDHPATSGEGHPPHGALDLLGDERRVRVPRSRDHTFCLSPCTFSRVRALLPSKINSAPRAASR